MSFYSCNCALPTLTGSTECCKNCSGNPNRHSNYTETFPNISQSSISLFCELCGKPTTDLSHHICQNCRDTLIAVMRWFKAQPDIKYEITNPDLKE